MLKKVGLRVCLCLLFSLANLGGSSEVLFSPDDKPGDKLIKRIDTAKHEIRAAVYMLTDSRIIKALVNAKERGVFVQVITDKVSCGGEYGKAGVLAEKGIDVFVYKPLVKESKNKKFYSADAIMHNKFAIIDNFLWTGSFNWTRSANSKNQENVIVTNDKNVIERFKAQFDLLKTRCESYANRTLPNSLNRGTRTKILDFVNVLRGKLNEAVE